MCTAGVQSLHVRRYAKDYNLLGHWTLKKVEPWPSNKIVSASHLHWFQLTEVYRQPSTRMLQFYVRDEPGGLAEALKAFRVSEMV